jgi:hypothetical protein
MYFFRSSVLCIFALIIISSNLVYANADTAGIQPNHLQNVTSLPEPQNSTHPTIPFLPTNPAAYFAAKNQSAVPQFAQRSISPLIAPTHSITPKVVKVFPVGIEGIDENSGGATPPDVAMGVGPNHVVEFNNIAGMIWDKSGNPVGSTLDLYSFFNAPSDFLSDPRIMYDSTSGRWFASMLDVTTSSVRVAISSTDNPTGAWTRYNIQFGSGPNSGVCPDQPKIGVSSDKFVVAANDFSNFCGVPPHSSTTNFLGADFYVYDKSQMLSASTLNHVSHFGPDLTKSAILSVPFTSTSQLYMASVDSSISTKLHLFILTGIPTGNNVGGVTKTVNDITVRTIKDPLNGIEPTADMVVTDDDRVEDAKWSNNKLWIALADTCKPTGDTLDRSCARLIQINTSGTPTVLQDFDIGVSNEYIYYPAISTEGSGNLDIVAGFSSSTVYPSILVTGQSLSDAPNTYQPPVVIASGSTPSDDGRYGDYFSAALDPSDNAKSWVAGEYMHIPSAGSHLWSTFITAITTTNQILSINPTSGHVGRSIIVTGNSFAPNSSTTVSFNSVTKSTVTTNTAGSFTTTFLVPPSPAGDNTVSAIDSVSNNATTAFTVTPTISLDTNMGFTGTSINVTGYGFAALSSTDIKYNSVIQTTTTTNGNGSFTTTFLAPPSVVDHYLISAVDGSSNTASTPFSIRNMILVPSFVKVGTVVTITGISLTPLSSTQIQYDGATKKIITTNSTGGFLETINIPQSRFGPHIIYATDAAHHTLSAVAIKITS